jgi:hypothetical protein
MRSQHQRQTITIFNVHLTILALFLGIGFVLGIWRGFLPVISFGLGANAPAVTVAIKDCTPQDREGLMTMC